MPSPAPPEVHDAALSAVAHGCSFAEAGRRSGLTREGVRDLVGRNLDRVERERSIALRAWAKNVRRTADANSRALAAEVVKDGVRGSDKAQCARALWEPLRGPESLTINGDVDASVNVSADVRALVVQGASAEQLRAKAEELRAKLGF